MASSTTTTGTPGKPGAEGPAARRGAKPRTDVGPGVPAARTGPRTATLDLPFVTATFRLPEKILPTQRDVSAAAETVQSYLPSTRKAAYFGGLAALAALEVIEWPVAMAIGAGTALLSRAKGEETTPAAGPAGTEPSTSIGGGAAPGRPAGTPPSS